MHTFRFIFPALIAFLLCAAPVRSQSVEDPSDQYFRAYVMNNEAGRIAQAGDLQQAVDKYMQAQAIFEGIAKNSPQWQPDMVKFRRDRVTDALSTLKAKLAAQPPPAPVPAPAPAPLTPGAPSAAIPAAPSFAPAPVPGSAVMSTGGTGSIDDALKMVKQAMESQIAPVQQQLTEALADVGRRQLAYETVVHQRDQVAGMYQTLSQTATGQQAKIVDLEKQVTGSTTAKADLDRLKAEHAETAAQLAETKSRLSKAESSVMKQSTELMATTSKLEMLQAERDELSKKLDTATKDRDALAKERELLTSERDKMAKERDAANTQIIGLKAATPVPSNLKELTAENEHLRKDLEEARKEVTSLKTDATRKDQEIAQLKGQVAQIQGELVGLKKENASYESQVSELTVQLKQIRSSLDNPKKGKGNEAPQLMAENQLLHDIILRQLRQQARAQQQKAAVIAEIQKTANASKDLIDQVEQLGGNRFTLTDEEQKLFSEPQLKEISGEGGIQATLMAKSDTKPATKSGEPAAKPPEPAASGAAAVDALLEKGNQLLQDNKFADAASAYQDVLRADPKNSSGFVGLAWAQVQQDKLKDAEATLKKSLAYDSSNATAHYMLGVTLFRSNQLNEAMASFQKSLDLNGKNARARHYLGVIASKMGLSERAEREFKAALAIDPSYGDAYFNLAVLYATWDPPKWDEARKNYNEALKNHVKPNPDLEKILKEDGPAVSKR